MGNTDKRNGGSRLTWLIAALLTITAIAAAHLAAAGVQCKQVFAQSHGTGFPSLLQSLQAGTLESPASAPAQRNLLSLLRIEDAEEALAPLAIQGKELTVVVHKQRLKWPAEARHRFDPDADETAHSFEVRDATGATVYRQKIEDAASESDLAEIRKLGRFTFTEAVYASRMQGAGTE